MANIMKMCFTCEHEDWAHNMETGVCALCEGTKSRHEFLSYWVKLFLDGDSKVRKVLGQWEREHSDDSSE